MIRRPVAVAMAYCMLLAGGAVALWRLPLDLAPAIEYPALSVVTPWAGVSAETIERLVSAPIEEIASTVAGIRRITSISSEGTSRVSVECEQHARMDLLRLELNEKLAALSPTFPPGVGHPAIEAYVPPDLRDLQGFMSFAIVGDRPPASLRALGKEILAPRLRTIKGVADVRVLGGEERQVLIELDRTAIAAMGLRLDQVASALRTMEFNAPLGAITRGTCRTVLSVRTAALTTDAVARLPVGRTTSGIPVFLRDCGTVRLTGADPEGYFRINGKPAVTLVVSKEPSVNALRLADRVAARIAELQSTLPYGVGLIPESDMSAAMRNDLTVLYRDVLFSIFCIGFVLILFLGSAKPPILVLSSIAFSLAGTLMVFWMLGIGLHVFSLAGLVLGFGRLVDDPIVVFDAIERRSAGMPRNEAIRRGVREIALPVVASTITTVGALVPVSFLPQDLRPYFMDFSLAVGIALVMSLAVSFTLIPVASAHLDLGPVFPSVYARVGMRVAALYGALLRTVLRHRSITIVIVLWMFGIPIWLLPDRLEGNGFPVDAYNATFGSSWYRSARPWLNHLFGGSAYLFFTGVRIGEVWTSGKESYLLVRVAFPQGTSLERSDEIARRVEAAMLAYGAKAGKITSQVSTGATFIRVAIPDALACSGVPYQMKNDLTMLASRTGGATIGVWGFGPGFSSGGDSAPTFAIRVMGYDYLRVKAIADELRRRLVENPRIADVDIDRSWSSQWDRSTELVARIDRQAVARHGVSLGEVIDALRVSTPGSLENTSLTIEGERVPTRVKVRGYQHDSVDDLGRTLVSTPDGRAVRMAALVSVKEQRTPGEILREDQSYVRWVTFEYRGPHRFGEMYVDAVLGSIPMPHGYRSDRSVPPGGLSGAEKHTMLMIGCVAFIIVFMVTAALYESFRKPFLIILAIPFSVIGLFLAFSVTATPFGRGGYAAVILLIGIVTSNSIVLVDALARACPGENASADQLIAAARGRLRPVFMTTLTTIGGLLPMLIAGDRSTVWYPLAVGTIGGLVSSTTLTMIMIPAMAMRKGKRRVHSLDPEGSGQAAGC